MNAMVVEAGIPPAIRRRGRGARRGLQRRRVGRGPPDCPPTPNNIPGTPASTTSPTRAPQHAPNPERAYHPLHCFVTRRSPAGHSANNAQGGIRLAFRVPGSLFKPAGRPPLARAGRSLGRRYSATAHVRVVRDVPCTPLCSPSTSRPEARCAQCACLAIHGERTQGASLKHGGRPQLARAAWSPRPRLPHDHAARATLGNAAVSPTFSPGFVTRASRRCAQLDFLIFGRGGLLSVR